MNNKRSTMKTIDFKVKDDITGDQFTVPVLPDDGTWDKEAISRFRSLTIDLGESSWGHRYRFTAEDILSPTATIADQHYDQRIFKRKQLIVGYLTSSAVRQWCEQVGLDLIDIRDMRGTTDWYDSQIMPRACQWYAQYHQGEHPEALDTGLYHFVKALMAAIVLTEETTLMDMASL